MTEGERSEIRGVAELFGIERLQSCTAFTAVLLLLLRVCLYHVTATTLHFLPIVLLQRSRKNGPIQTVCCGAQALQENALRCGCV